MNRACTFKVCRKMPVCCSLFLPLIYPQRLHQSHQPDACIVWFPILLPGKLLWILGIYYLCLQWLPVEKSEFVWGFSCLLQTVADILMLQKSSRIWFPSHSLKYPCGMLLFMRVGLSCPVICVYPKQHEIMKPELLTEAFPVSVSKHWGIMKWTHCISHTQKHARIQICASIDTLSLAPVWKYAPHTHTVTCTYNSNELIHCNRDSSLSPIQFCTLLHLSLLFPCNLPTQCTCGDWTLL